MKKTWYDIKASGDEAAPVTTISIHEEIGEWGISAKDFIAEYRNINPDSQIELSINSMGGSMFDALAVYHVMVRDSPRITARVEGFALSAATLPLMAASRRVVPRNAYLMIHNPMLCIFGDMNAKELREGAEFLEKITDGLVNIYASGTAGSTEKLKKMVDAETWMNGDEALENGFATATVDAVPARNSLESLRYLSCYTRMPTALLAVLQTTKKGDPPDDDSRISAEEIVEVCNAANLGELASPLIRAGANRQSVEARLSDATKIVALGEAAKRPDDARTMILSGVPPEVARKLLASMRAADMSGIPARPFAEKNTAPTNNERLSFISIYDNRS
jgi:ATP-dependent protease ClpP protease subunit